MAARFKDDPLSEHLNALALCVGALGDIYQASEETQIDIAETLKSQTDIVTKEAIVRVEASGAELAAKIGPQIAASMLKWTTRQQFKIPAKANDRNPSRRSVRSCRRSQRLHVCRRALMSGGLKARMPHTPYKSR